jgi:BirA family transcriptional regulator, biotin operon repressor / biotin---[acetyl-CoA-carboxylase] ligase
MQLHSAAAAAGYRLLNHETVASTNAEALALARCGERGPLWITAQQQTAGRGRRGSEWISRAGNLYATLLLHDPAPAEHAPELSFVAALALQDAIGERVPALRDELKLKWPNDLLCRGAKVAGILIESERADDALTVVIGIGVNCEHHPMQTPYPATDLATAGADISAETLFAALSCTMLERVTQWRRGAGFAGIRADWMARATGIGGDMRVRLPDRELLGRGEALDDHGRLLLRLADGSVQAIAAGEVFPLAVAPAGVPTTGRAR